MHGNTFKNADAHIEFIRIQIKQLSPQLKRFRSTTGKFEEYYAALDGFGLLWMASDGFGQRWTAQYYVAGFGRRRLALETSRFYSVNFFLFCSISFHLIKSETD